ncbi:related to PHM7 - similarity to A.thaliana hyp1 protein [Fusarium torulosum]|uniref:Related to PHM7 - similarity to A.thaliana hyp1 protein n=1 Tax=Fusarium torulosum TaxID=33205 RepID=A0AAE8MG84_9HYPO|nr:related to PHM7 - similarity to A.thaliana hyp1 protein [Fusarium torulosum]
MSSTEADASASATESASGTASSLASTIASSLLSSAISASESISASTTTSDEPTKTSSGVGLGITPSQTSAADKDKGIGIVSFLTAVAVAMAIFAVQILLFLVLRNKLARIFKPKTYLVPERERTESPPSKPLAMLKTLWHYGDREVIEKCGLDAYFFLRYLKTLLIIFIPIGAIVMPILIPMNYVGGLGQKVDVKDNDDEKDAGTPTGLDTLSWGNVSPKNSSRYGAHLLMAILVVIWVCWVFFFELRVYIKVRQDYLTSAEHRLRASATTVLVNSIPAKWLSEEALMGLFDVFPGGIRNIWLNRDLSTLLDKVKDRNKIHLQLEQAETDLIKDAKKAQLKQQKAEEKKRRKEMKLKAMTKQERADQNARDDAEAQRLAQGASGTAAGDKHDVPHSVDAGVRESHHEAFNQDTDNYHEEDHKRSKGFKVPLLGDPFLKVGHGILGAVSKAGNNVDDTLETTNGFVGLSESTHVRSDSRTSDRARQPAPMDEDDLNSPSDTLRVNNQSRNTARSSAESTAAINPKPNCERPGKGGNTVRKIENLDEIYSKDEAKWWEFWKPPPGAYASPVPQGDIAPAFKQKKSNESKPLWQRIKYALPFVSPEIEVEPMEYPTAYNTEYKEDAEPAVWEKYLKKKNRPTHRLPMFGKTWLFPIPFVTKKVDTIYWCRQELARLNLEIEMDQQHPERFPLMNSAFIQFNHQVAAHMACQSVIHHVPRQMAPRMNEISPKDVDWDNMAFTWWQEWLRSAFVFVIVVAMIFLWAIPVAWTAALSQLDNLIRSNEWLSFLSENNTVHNIAKAVSGVLPAIVLGLLLVLIPIILDFLAGFRGAKTGSQRVEFVQVFYFAFLFIQVFLIVSIASFFAASLDDLVHNVQKLQTVRDVLDLLAYNLPSAANYFFSYMILQAMSTSSATLLQLGALVMWYVVARILDSTARNKWSRNTSLRQVKWGAFFPIYTNFACIGLVYCVIAPLISIFAILTFALLWFAQRYAMLYVTRFEHDTGGVLYPRAINQTFTGIYVMELCMAGLFFLVQDEKGKNVCTPHGIIMIVVLILTILYQLLLNYSFSPLFRYLPITFEDEAVLRDQAFQRAQDQRLGLLDDDELTEEPDNSQYQEKAPPLENDQGIEMRRFGTIRRPVKQVGAWAKDGGNQIRKLAGVNKAKDKNKRASEYRRKHRQKDVEAQLAIGDALFGGIHDEIEDLTPEERDALVRHAFQHEALRARRPTVWIPHDDLGISEDEIRRTQEYSEHIWISNEGTALDSKVRVVYGRAPPDFSEIDLINL